MFSHRSRIEASYLAMGAWLAVFSVVWGIGASLGTYWFMQRGRYAEGAMSAILLLLVVGLWARWAWVKVPLVVYWSIMAVAGLVAIYLRGWAGITTLRYLSPIYFLYILSKWHPENWPRKTVVI